MYKTDSRGNTPVWYTLNYYISPGPPPLQPSLSSAAQQQLQNYFLAPAKAKSFPREPTFNMAMATIDPKLSLLPAGQKIVLRDTPTFSGQECETHVLPCMSSYEFMTKLAVQSRRNISGVVVDQIGWIRDMVAGALNSRLATDRETGAAILRLVRLALPRPIFDRDFANVVFCIPERPCLSRPLAADGFGAPTASDGLGAPTAPGGEFKAPSLLGAPVGIAAGSDGSVWFTEQGVDAIARLTFRDGRITEFFTPSSGSMPTDITTGRDGSLWFTEPGADRVGRMRNGTITEFVTPTAASAPLGIASAEDGRIWFTERGANQIGRINPNGSMTEFRIPTSDSAPGGIVAGPGHRMWFTETAAARIGSINSAGAITEFALPPGAVPGSIAASREFVWYTDLGRSSIGRLSVHGDFTEFRTPTGGSAPERIVASDEGELWFTEQAVGRIARITSDGRITEFSLPGRDRIADGIVVADGIVWVTETDTNRIAALICDADTHTDGHNNDKDQRRNQLSNRRGDPGEDHAPQCKFASVTRDAE